MTHDYPSESGEPRREPMLNLPGIVLAMIVVFSCIRLFEDWLLPAEMYIDFLLYSAFLPVRYIDAGAALPPTGAAIWTFVTYGFLHANWTHLIANSIWMAAFGSVVARRLGPMRFVILSLLAAIAGAAMHLLFHIGDIVPMVGASAMVSAYMAAAARFAFARTSGFPLDHTRPALSLIDTFRNRSAFTFLAIWFVFNYVAGSGILPIAGDDVSIAWQAHIGGFLLGLFGFSLFDNKTNRV